MFFVVSKADDEGITVELFLGEVDAVKVSGELVAVCNIEFPYPGDKKAFNALMALDEICEVGSSVTDVLQSIFELGFKTGINTAKDLAAEK